MDEGARRGIDAGVDRVTIQEAARRLGVSEGAVRKRVKRKTLRHDKAPDGRVFVYLDAGVDAGVDEGVDAPNDALIAQLRDEVAYLREESRRKDEIIMQQATTVRQLTAGTPSEPRESLESEASPDPSGTPSETPRGVQEATEGAETVEEETAVRVARAELAKVREQAAADRERADAERAAALSLEEALEAERSKGFWSRLFGR
jgi:AcrR family transcriptional regulator